MNTYRGQSKQQLWYELHRTETHIILVPEYHGGRGTDGAALTILTLQDFARCNYEFVGEAPLHRAVGYRREYAKQLSGYLRNLELRKAEEAAGSPPRQEGAAP